MISDTWLWPERAALHMTKLAPWDETAVVHHRIYPPFGKIFPNFSREYGVRAGVYQLNVLRKFNRYGKKVR